MKFRMHRGGLAESMRTAREIEPTKEAIKVELRKENWDESVVNLDEAKIKVEECFMMPDDRIGWGWTYLVTVNGQAVAYTDGPVT